jgi:hypothetical protein
VYLVAIAFSVSETFGSESTPFNDSFFDELFLSKSRVDSLRTAGLGYARAKNDNASPGNLSVRKYGFLGDPALTPPLPRGRGAWEKGPLDSLLRGDPVVIQGHALMPDSTADTLSTGTVQILVQGPPFVRTQVAPLTSSRTTYRIPGPTLYRGMCRSQRGRSRRASSSGRTAASGRGRGARLCPRPGAGVGLRLIPPDRARRFDPDRRHPAHDPPLLPGGERFHGEAGEAPTFETRIRAAWT